MRVIVFLALIVALLAIRLQQHDGAPSASCKTALDASVGNKNGVLTNGGKEFSKSCNQLEVTTDSTCNLWAWCLSGGYRSKVYFKIENAAKKTCCPTLK
jgi:hypothetical protein